MRHRNWRKPQPEILVDSRLCRRPLDQPLDIGVDAECRSSGEDLIKRRARTCHRIQPVQQEVLVVCGMNGIPILICSSNVRDVNTRRPIAARMTVDQLLS